jgi:CRP/FNR family transcriptional regulator, cyclic AMP receptor protein
LRRYPFFCCIDEELQRAVAMAGEEMTCESGALLFEEGQTVESLYLLVDGSVDLSYAAGDAQHQELLIGEVNAGEVFGISALIEPYFATATARVASASRILKFKARALNTLCEADNRLGYALMRQAAKLALERLHFALAQHAAARVTV